MKKMMVMVMMVMMVMVKKKKKKKMMMMVMMVMMVMTPCCAATSQGTQLQDRAPAAGSAGLGGFIDEWLQAVREGLGNHGTWSWLHRSQAPPDHPTALGHREGHYLKFALLRLLDGSAAV